MSTASELGLFSTLALIALLIVKELAGSKVESSVEGTLTLARSLDQVMNVAIVPLLIVFGFIVVVQIVAVLH
jgi:hypothetical protein